MLVKPVIYSSESYCFTFTFEDYVSVRGTDDDTNSVSFIEFYRIRPQHMEDNNFFEFAKRHYRGKNNSFSTSRKDKIVQVFPKLDKNQESNVELICKQKLMLHSA